MSVEQRKVGVIGGSFDPVHLGHLGIAESAREAFGLDKVIFVPNALPPHKSGAVAPAADRLAMVELAVRDNPRFSASDIEMRRDGPSYTIDTLAELGRLGLDSETGLRFIVGADSLRDLPTWHRAEELVARYDFIIVARPGVAGPDWESLEAAFGCDAAARLRRGFLETALFNISATDVRSRVKAGRSIRYLVPEVVERYILRRGLYR
jgi:nicotinate-nucleotide adenylyltransferase